jgi:serine/threonine protein kinase
MIAFLCSNCGAELRVKEALAGAKGKCPRCKQLVEAPLDALSGPDMEAWPALPTADPGETATSSLPAAGFDTDFESYAAHSDRDLAFLDPPQSPGELGRVGPYRVTKVLGSGAMGIVFQAEDVALKRPIALKSLKADLAARDADRRRFLREAQTAAAIDHPHIVTIYQVGEHHGIPYLAMKLLRGQSLEDRLNDRGGCLPLPEVLRIGQEIAEGLAAAHAQGLIHRDIKPANIWLEEERDWVRIVDFGLARAANEEAHLTQTGTIVGTPSYMAPEQANAEPVDHRGDLFSLGCLLYRMSTGQLPFRGKSMTAVLLAVAAATPIPPRDLNPSLPPAFSSLILSLLEKKPADRPISAQAVWQALERAKNPVASGPSESPAARKARTAAPAAPSTPAKGRSTHRPAEEGEQAAALEAVEAEGRRTVAKRKPSTPAKKKRSQGGVKEDELERKVMKLAVVVAVAIFCLIAFLIVRHFLSKRPTTDGMNWRPFDSRVIRVVAAKGGEAWPRCPAAISCL